MPGDLFFERDFESLSNLSFPNVQTNLLPSIHVALHPIHFDTLNIPHQNTSGALNTQPCLGQQSVYWLDSCHMVDMHRDHLLTSQQPLHTLDSHALSTLKLTAT